MQYSKQPLSLNEQIDLLTSRGLHVPDPQVAFVTLRNISYYRLSAYFFPFQRQKDVFNPGTSFSDILNLYQFDHRLRVISFRALETVEIGFRTRMTYHLVMKYGAFAQTNSRRFDCPKQVINGYGWAILGNLFVDNLTIQRP
jgi:abortive infection bacteriophage resistance protein